VVAYDRRGFGQTLPSNEPYSHAGRVGGAPTPELDSETARLDRLLDDALATNDLDEVNRLQAWLSLDWPAQAEGRVTGSARTLFLEMNSVILKNDLEPGDSADRLLETTQLIPARMMHLRSRVADADAGDSGRARAACGPPGG
jgi:hypothetical protein